MKDWSKYFEHNRKHRREIPWEQGVHVPAPLRSDLIRSLQRFQLGESGDGFFLRRNASGQPMAYREALDFFIAEEQEHARLMGEVLDRIGEWWGRPAAEVTPEMLDLWPNDTSREQSLELSWFGTTNRYFTLCVHAPYDSSTNPTRTVDSSVLS